MSLRRPKFKSKAKIKSPTLSFYRKIQNYEEDVIRCGSELIDRVLLLKKGESLLIKTEPYSGSSAICFEYASYHTNIANSYCLYVDCNDSFLPSRTSDFNLDNLIHLRPNSSLQVIDTIKELSVLDQNFLVILDNPFLLKDGPTISNFLISIRKILPDCTIIATERILRPHSNVWNKVCTLSFKQKHYVERNLIGHTISLKIGLEEIVHYLSYKHGRLSKVYEHMILDIESNNKTKSDIFEFDGYIIKGFWAMLKTIEM